MASMATTRGAACPRRVSMDKTRQDKVVKMFLWARQNRHTALLAVTCELDPRGRRALSQRRSGGVISRERRAWGSGNPGTRQAAGGLGRAAAGDGYLPRSAGMRARGQRTRGDPAELPHRLAVGYGGNDERRLPCRGTDIHKHWNKIKTFQNGKQIGVNGRRLRFWSGLLSRCTHEGGTGTRRRGYKLK